MKKFSTILCMGLMLMAVSSLTAQDKKSKLKVWSYQEDLEAYIDAGNFGYRTTHPDVDVTYVSIPTPEFPYKLDEVLKTGNGAPDVICLEDSFVRRYVELGCLLPLDDLYKEVKAKMSDYPMKVGSYDGHVYAMSWQVYPGAMFYRRSLAKKYWGTDDPKEVQKKVASFDTLLKTARELKKKSNGKCRMLSTTEDLFRPYLGARKKPWVVDDKLYIDPVMEKYMDVCKIFYDEDLDCFASQWDELWYASMNDDVVDDKGKPVEVMCYFLASWGLPYILGTEAQDTAGDWAMCAGPSPYYWGGNWIAAYKDTKNPNAAKEMIRYIATNDEFNRNVALTTGEIVGNLNVQKQIKKLFSSPYLSGQNHYELFCDVSKKINGSLAQATDMWIESMFMEALEDYVHGKKTKKQALTDFRSEVYKQLGYE